MNRDELLERILKSYAGSYDIVKCGEKDAPMVVQAAFHEHSVSYFLSKRAEMYSMDRHEYAYFYSVPHLTKEICEACLAKTLELGEPLVEPKKGHMSTNLVSILICDEADPEAIQMVRRVRIRKNFQFSLLGWMEVQAAIAEVGKTAAVGNAAARNTVGFLKNLFRPPKRRKGGLLGRFLR